MSERAARLRGLLLDPEPTVLMEAHSGLSAAVVEEAGFPGIWASSLSVSAMLGVRDCNEASWTQMVEISEFMNDATTLPILFDADTGYGNFNNVRRLVGKLEARGIAGVCIEDKLFPKLNSHIRGAEQALADTDEFCGRIKAAKDTQQDDSFVVVARLEGMVVGLAFDEILVRAEKYIQAGADALFLHNVGDDAGQVLAFQREWADRSPVIIAPATYFASAPTRLLNAGFAAIIWANHLLRASLAAMQRIAAELQSRQDPAAVEAAIATLDDLFELQHYSELEAAGLRYLPRASVNSMESQPIRGASG